LRPGRATAGASKPRPPQEETAFHVLQASTPDAVREALERAGMAPDRVVIAESLGRG